MKLYYSPGACSLAPHIVLRDTKLSFVLERVDLAAHTTENGGDYYEINPKGGVPLLELGTGERLSEGATICQYLADLCERTDLMPAPGTWKRYRVMEWQNYIASEIHKSFTPLFNSTADAAVKEMFRKSLRKKYEWIDSRLARSSYLMGDEFTVADAYLFTVTRWAGFVGVDLMQLHAIDAFMQRVSARDAVHDALEAEGLVAGKAV